MEILGLILFISIIISIYLLCKNINTKENQSKKTCVYCRKKINSKAMLCPYCRSKTNYGYLVEIISSTIIIVIILLFTLLFIN